MRLPFLEPSSSPFSFFNFLFSPFLFTISSSSSSSPLMASSSGSLDTSGNSHPSFTFSSHPFMTTSYSDILASGIDDPPSSAAPHGSLRSSTTGVPKFKSLPPPSLPLSPPPLSPSSFFAIPPGLSPAELLDSPVLLSASHPLPSPTTGSFPSQSLNWKSNYGYNQQSIKEENKYLSNFSFQTQSSKPPPSSFQPSSTTAPMNWSFQEQGKKQDGFSSENNMVKQSFSPEYGIVQNQSQINGGGQLQSDYGNNYPQQSQTVNRRSDDGYNWRKYGQKQVKGSENPRSYYKCTFPSCPTKKKVERSLDGQITEIVYKGSHNHPKPQSTRRSSLSSAGSSLSMVVSNPAANEMADQSFTTQGSAQFDGVATPENSSISIGDDDFDRSSQKSKSVGDDYDKVEPEAKRWRREVENNEGMSAAGSRTVREPRVVVQTTSDIDILDDGYRWRKYGQKVVKGNPNPRSYYKCTNPGCPVRKHVERASHDQRAVITTYEGKHNHDVPPARGSGSHSLSRAFPNNDPPATAIRPSAVAHQSNNGGHQSLQTAFAVEMVQNPNGFSFPEFGNSMGMGSGSYMNQTQPNHNLFPRAKEEPRDHDMFIQSLLC
ncbi:WRKY transcription factor WRKY24-like [Cucurbita pepo subsp. pepo]|uniref:WRKY transcription factor WRKY24-like n=1 Tax=Cucurbita pepo subsp. pepo TaxID=3664 RepID=UPI000C9D6D78|nr:WRKY transcription factor WRKY24-like [Cucurbita pepo subsp. pepo]XP_023519408.1 WRKY transcription factor WRKY24-like [Cucurbita pepo subsp. pepo]XP_023519409.1 WRKY transcription factor WRKY24-like [Cucurbita pepo subsp. pepo]XP_023519410.1 WRKY transcription factor WRKY24-like [Cucurbita pepo subsp. pepo]